VPLMFRARVGDLSRVISALYFKFTVAFSFCFRGVQISS
jgi:hypothetical protein